VTRINLVNVQDLADQHLMAEWREIKMIPPALRRSLVVKKQEGFNANHRVHQIIPATYILGEGHVRFFYDKLMWLKFRYEELTQELLTRGFELSDVREYDVYINDLPAIFHQSFVPDLNEKKVSVERIVRRLNEKPTFYRFYGDVMPPSFFEARYNHQLIVDALR
jgi:deoxyribonuclease (pyrimidine dimer)